MAKADSGLPKGNGAKRISTRFVVHYGPPKARKTTAASQIKGAKWMISDQNAIPTLEALGRLPPSEDIHEISDLMEAQSIIGQYLDAADAGKVTPKTLPAFIYDSGTATADFHQQDIAKQTQQRYLGDSKKENGWQLFNAEFGKLIDLLGELARHTNVIVICHAKEKFEPSKGDFHGLNLPPQMATKLGRVCNWLTYQTCRTMAYDDHTPLMPYETVITDKKGNKLLTECAIHTVNCGLWPAAVSAPEGTFQPMELPDLGLMLKKAKCL